MVLSCFKQLKLQSQNVSRNLIFNVQVFWNDLKFLVANKDKVKNKFCEFTLKTIKETFIDNAFCHKITF